MKKLLLGAALCLSLLSVARADDDKMQPSGGMQHDQMQPDDKMQPGDKMQPDHMTKSDGKMKPHKKGKMSGDGKMAHDNVENGGKKM